MCPKGDDPITTDQNYYQFQLEAQSTSTTTGYVGIVFSGVTSFIPVSTSSTSSLCVDGLMASGIFAAVGCVYTKVSTTYHRFDITIYQWPVTPKENNLFNHEGSPSISSFRCDTSRTTLSSCTFSAKTTTNVRVKSLFWFCYTFHDSVFVIHFFSCHFFS